MKDLNYEQDKIEEDLYYAHIRVNQDGSQTCQTVREHCRNTAEYAEESLKDISLGKTAYLSGLLHDMGKYTAAFQNYIRRAAKGENVVRGSVNHTFAGVKYVMENFPAKDTISYAARDIVSYAIGSHHGQFDCVDEDGRNGFEYRRTKTGIFYDEAVKNYLLHCTAQDELMRLFELSQGEIRNALLRLRDLTKKQYANEKKKRNKTLLFYIGLIARIVQSAVIEGDRRDTAEFMQGISLKSMFPFHDPDNCREFWNRQLLFAENRIDSLDTSKKINHARRMISDLCKKQADENERLLQLNVPTGSGKTLSSLRFALAHALKFRKKRIIFTAPLLSIIEQNSDVIKQYIRDKDLILTHYSGAVQPENRDDELNLNELRVESWNAPIIITTLVQLLNTFFGGRTSNIRRYHALCNSVIVIDEVQSVPTNMLTLFNLTINFLTQFCNTTVVLCSATQPNWKKADYPLVAEPKDLVPYEENLWNVFRRTEILNAGGCKSSDLPDKLLSLYQNDKSLLVICNKKDESEMLYRNFSDQGVFECFHLSAAMCMEHRRKVLDRLRTQMKHPDKKQIICVSTQVIEAGVDISFGEVIRLMAGLDNVVQASGRCNRNGESTDLGKVYIVNCMDENLSKLAEIKSDKDAALMTIAEYERNAARYRYDLSSDEAIQTYYRNLYALMKENQQDDPIENTHYTIFELLSDNRTIVSGMAQKSHVYLMQQAFKTAGRLFHVFDDSTIDVIVPYEDGCEIISELCSERALYDYQYCQELLSRAHDYTVTLYPYQKQKLLEERAIIEIRDLDVWYLSEGYYDKDVGVRMQKGDLSYLEV